MSNLGLQFVLHARRVQLVDVIDETQARPLENTFLRTCSFCKELMPHYQHENYCQCAVCQTKTFRLSENGYIRRDTAIVLNWLVVVLVVLFVFLKDWKW